MISTFLHDGLGRPFVLVHGRSPAIPRLPGVIDLQSTMELVTASLGDFCFS